MRRRTFSAIALATLVMAAGAGIAPAEAYTTTGCHWSSANVVWTLEVGGDYGTQASAAASTWSAATDVNLSSPGGSLMLYTDNQGANNSDGYTTWTCWPLTHNMIGANVTLNPYYTDSFPSNKKRAIWTHELGHGLGLNHAATEQSIMYTCAACVYNDYGYYTPRGDDINGMNSIY